MIPNHAAAHKVGDMQIRPMTQPSHAHLSAKNATNVTENIGKNVSSPVFPPACQLGPSFGRLLMAPNILGVENDVERCPQYE